jgi:hypothetical protein
MWQVFQIVNTLWLYSKYNYLFYHEDFSIIKNLDFNNFTIFYVVIV